MLTIPNIKEGKGFPPFIYIYIYIYREREREREVKILFFLVPKMKKLSLFCNNKKANTYLLNKIIKRNFFNNEF